MKQILIFCLLCANFFTFAQISYMKEDDKPKEVKGSKPPVPIEKYDSLYSWDKYKMETYIGQNLYLPKCSLFNTDCKRTPFFTKKLQQVPVNIEMRITWFGNKMVSIDTVITFNYKSSQARNMDKNILVGSDSTIENRYYTLVDVLSKDNAQSLIDSLNGVLEHYYRITYKNLNTHIYVRPLCVTGCDGEAVWNSGNVFEKRTYPSSLFLIKDNVTNELFYTFGPQNFILVAYFEKQKNLYLNKTFLFDSIKSSYSYRDLNKKNLSKWKCVKVVLNDRNDIVYIFEDDMQNRVVENQSSLRFYILESIYLQKQLEKKQKELDLANKKQLQKEERERIEKARIEKEKREQTEFFALQKSEEQARKQKLINKYGAKNGALVAKGETFIGMTREMLLDIYPYISVLSITSSQEVLRECNYGRTSCVKFYLTNKVLTKIEYQ